MAPRAGPPCGSRANSWCCNDARTWGVCVRRVIRAGPKFTWFRCSSRSPSWVAGSARGSVLRTGQSVLNLLGFGRHVVIMPLTRANLRSLGHLAGQPRTPRQSLGEQGKWGTSLPRGGGSTRSRTRVSIRDAPSLAWVRPRTIRVWDARPRVCRCTWTSSPASLGAMREWSMQFARCYANVLEIGKLVHHLSFLFLIFKE